MAPPPNLLEEEAGATDVDVAAAEVVEVEELEDEGVGVADEEGDAVDCVELLKPPGSRSAIRGVSLKSFWDPY